MRTALKTILFLFVAFLPALAKGQGTMTPNYSYVMTETFSSDGTTVYIYTGVTGSTTCPGGCPSGVYHSATLTNEATGYGGVYSGLDSVTPSSYLAASKQTNVPVTAFDEPGLYVDLLGQIICTRIGNLSSGSGQPAGNTKQEAAFDGIINDQNPITATTYDFYCYNNSDWTFTHVGHPEKFTGATYKYYLAAALVSSSNSPNYPAPWTRVPSNPPSLIGGSGTNTDQTHGIGASCTNYQSNNEGQAEW